MKNINELNSRNRFNLRLYISNLLSLIRTSIYKVFILLNKFLIGSIHSYSSKLINQDLKNDSLLVIHEMNTEIRPISLDEYKFLYKLEVTLLKDVVSLDANVLHFSSMDLAIVKIEKIQINNFISEIIKNGSSTL